MLRERPINRQVDARAVRFREVVEPHLQDALAFARFLSGSSHDAEDILQEACIRAFAAIDGYKGPGAKPWLLSIVRNTCMTWLAKNRPKSLVLVGTTNDLDDLQQGVPASAPDPELALIGKADDLAIQTAIESVPAHFREVLVLRDVNGLDYKEIAGMLAIPIGTVMSRLARGRAHLTALLAKAI